MLVHSEESVTIQAQQRQAPEALADQCQLKGWQRACMEARLAVLAEVDRLAAVQGLMEARATVSRLAAEERLPEALQALVPFANQRGGKKRSRSLTVASLRRWDDARQRSGSLALAPRPTKPEQVLPPAWMRPFMALWARPGKPSVAACYELLSEQGVRLPSLRTVQQQVRRLSAITRNRGRMGPRALCSLKAYVVRDVSELWPTAVYVADGHTADFEVAHPVHGKPFRPEITTVIDVFTRRAVGWSAALSESTWSVLDAARHAFETSGLCDIWYVDRGNGFNNQAFDAELTGFLARLNVTKENSLPYNSQARGVVERLHQSIWVRGAKTLRTYIGEAMDDEARQRAFKVTRRDIRRVGRSRHLMDWPKFLVWAEAQIEAYNDRPHSALPKIRDTETGKRRHRSPNEAWAAAKAKGWQPDTLSEAEAADLFRPYERRSVRRAMVSLFGNSYFHIDLEAYHGEDVLVGYDIHDACRVWVRDLQERLICVAEFEGNSRAYFPVSAVEAAHERRIKGRLRRVEAKKAEIEAERGPAPVVEQDAAPLSVEQKAEADIYLRQLAEPKPKEEPFVAADDKRPFFRDDYAWLAWLLANPEAVTDHDRRLLRQELQRQSVRIDLEMQGFDLETLRDLGV